MNLSTIIVASISRPELNLWVNGSIATMIAGASFFLFGALVGWWMWRNARSDCAEIAQANKGLVQDYKRRNRNFQRLNEDLAPVANRLDSLNQ